MLLDLGFATFDKLHLLNFGVVGQASKDEVH
jgi:hypothetical protein